MSKIDFVSSSASPHRCANANASRRRANGIDLVASARRVARDWHASIEQRVVLFADIALNRHRRRRWWHRRRRRRRFAAAHHRRRHARRRCCRDRFCNRRLHSFRCRCHRRRCRWDGRRWQQAIADELRARRSHAGHHGIETATNATKHDQSNMQERSDRVAALTSVDSRRTPERCCNARRRNAAPVGRTRHQRRKRASSLASALSSSSALQLSSAPRPTSRMSCQ